MTQTLMAGIWAFLFVVAHPCIADDANSGHSEQPQGYRAILICTKQTPQITGRLTFAYLVTEHDHRALIGKNISGPTGVPVMADGVLVEANELGDLPWSHQIASRGPVRMRFTTGGCTGSGPESCSLRATVEVMGGGLFAGAASTSCHFQVDEKMNGSVRCSSLPASQGQSALVPVLPPRPLTGFRCNLAG